MKTITKRIFVLLLFVFSISQFITSCKKSESFTNETNQQQQKFLEKSDYSQATKRVANELLRQDKRNNFIQRIIKKDGYAIWDKVIEVSASAQNGRTNTNDTILYVPLVLPNTEYVNSFIYAKLNGSIYLELHRSSTFPNYGFGKTSDAGINAEKIALQTMFLENKVFGHTKFFIPNDSLYANEIQTTNPFVKDKTITITPLPTATNGRSFLLINYQVCNSHLELECSTNHSCCPDGSCSACQAVCWVTKTQCTTVSTLVYVDNNNGGGSNGNPWSDPGGGGGGPTYFPAYDPNSPIACNPTPLLDNGLIPCDEGNETGWLWYIPYTLADDDGNPLDDTYNKQLALVNKWKNKIANESTSKRGNFGEVASDVKMQSKGFKPMHNRITNIEAGGHHGIDGLFYKDIEESGVMKRKYFVIEAKFAGGLNPPALDGNGTVASPKQLSNQWLSDPQPPGNTSYSRIGYAAGMNNTLGNSIYNSSNLTRLIAYIYSDGNVVYYKVTPNGTTGCTISSTPFTLP